MLHFIKSTRPLLIATLIASGLLSPAYAEIGVTDTEILFGQSAALSSPSSTRVVSMANAAKMYFNKMNASGGIYGRKIRLISYDDHYDPKEAVDNTRKLIEQDKVFAPYKFFGTQVTKAVIPLIDRANIAP